MSFFYRFLYRVGIKPWEQMAELPITEQIAGLFARAEDGHEPPFGRALDLGCGSGIWSVELARRGWEVTGVDVVPKAVRAARARARDAGVEARSCAVTSRRWGRSSWAPGSGCSWTSVRFTV